MVKYGGRADMTEDEFLGAKCFGYVRPEFAGKVTQVRACLCTYVDIMVSSAYYINVYSCRALTWPL